MEMVVKRYHKRHYAQRFVLNGEYFEYFPLLQTQEMKLHVEMQYFLRLG